MPHYRRLPNPHASGVHVMLTKIQTKDEVLAELMAEHIALKKRLGAAVS